MRSNAGTETILNGLNTRQKEAVLHEGAPLLILAGAGSGKTRVITTKIAWLVSTGRADPREILAVTFTNKAAGEMLSRVTAMVPSARGVLIRTFHSFGAWLLRRNAVRAGMDPNFSIYDEDDSLSLLKTVRESLKKQELRRYVRLISRAKDYDRGPDDDLRSLSGDPDLPEIYSDYQRRLQQMGNADFGDLIMKPAALLSQDPEVRSRIHERFRFVLVDEYQDSNVAQYHLLQQLAGPSSYVCVVGDDDQSIYRFRGAEVQNIVSFPDRFADTHVVRLEQNYRSTSAILDVAGSVVSRNQGRLGKTLWTARTGGAKPIYTIHDDQDAEAAYCASLLADGRLQETAILYRTNAQSLPLENAFTRMGIPYRVVGALRFYEREEVKDCLAFLALLSNPRDEVAFRRVVNKPSRGIGAKSLAVIMEAAVGDAGTAGDLIEGAAAARERLSKKAAKGVSSFLSVYRETIKQLEEDPLPHVVRTMIMRSGLYAYHSDQDQTAGTSRTSNMEELVNASAEYHSGPAGLTQFLEAVELDRSRFTGQEEDGTPRVTLITMHNTKGLEFPRVIITGLDDGLFPRWQGQDAEDLEEERRIFYVSITRAMDELYLTSCRNRRLWGRYAMFSPSRFLSEIPRELLEVEDDYVDELGFGAAVSTETTADGTGDAEFPDLQPGTRIYHDDYGPGTIVKRWYNGRDLAVIVRLENGRTVRFLPAYTPLERIGSDD